MPRPYTVIWTPETLALAEVLTRHTGAILMPDAYKEKAGAVRDELREKGYIIVSKAEWDELIETWSR